MEGELSDIWLCCIINIKLVMRFTFEGLFIFICYFYVTVCWRKPCVNIKEGRRLVHKHTPSLVW